MHTLRRRFFKKNIKLSCKNKTFREVWKIRFIFAAIILKDTLSERVTQRNKQVTRELMVRSNNAINKIIKIEMSLI